MVEGAFIMVPFVLVILAILEFGLAFKDYLTVANTTRAGARVASAVANDGTGDWHVVQAMKQASAAMPASSIDYIVVYEAASFDQTVPPGACASGVPSSVSGARCNVYTAADFAALETSFGTCTDHGVDTASTPGPDRFYCPRARKVSEADPPDFVGVYVKAEHSFITGMFGSVLDLTDTTVLRIEPRRAT